MRACAQRVLGGMAARRVHGGASARTVSALRHLAREERAQATLEYALTLFALMALISGVALLWRAGSRACSRGWWRTPARMRSTGWACSISHCFEHARGGCGI